MEEVAAEVVGGLAALQGRKVAELGGKTKPKVPAKPKSAQNGHRSPSGLEIGKG
jgi:hypothetical protein